MLTESQVKTFTDRELERAWRTVYGKKRERAIKKGRLALQLMREGGDVVDSLEAVQDRKVIGLESKEIREREAQAEKEDLLIVREIVRRGLSFDPEPEPWPFVKTLDVSTAHLPGPKPDFGKLRTVEHEHGWIVFVMSDLSGQEIVPAWFHKMYSEAVVNGCVLINFDKDGNVFEGLWPTWEW